MKSHDWRMAFLGGILLVLFFHFVTSISWSGSLLRAAVGLGAGLFAIGIRRASSRNHE
jgi:hypothetical protein